MKNILTICALLLTTLALSGPAIAADADFYIEDCKKVAGGKCKGAIVDGPRCLKKSQGKCKKYAKSRDCKWESDKFGARKWVCDSDQGECLAYEEVCDQYEKVCQGGYTKSKSSCKKTLKPYAQIKDKLTLAIYQSYIASLGNSPKRPLNATIAKEFQPHFNSVKLNTLSVALAKDSAVGPGVTDCTVMYFSDPALVDRLTTGKALDDVDDVMYFLHSVRHAEQCVGMGGRDVYAKEWFKEIPVEVKGKKKVEPVIEKSVKDIRAKDMEYLHDFMPIEEDAINYSISMIPNIQTGTRHGGTTPKGKKAKNALGIEVGSVSKRGLYGKGN